MGAESRGGRERVSGFLQGGGRGRLPSFQGLSVFSFLPLSVEELFLRERKHGELCMLSRDMQL